MPFAAKMNDPVVGTDNHIVLVVTPGGTVPTLLPNPFSGTITGGCSTDVVIDGQPAAVVGSTATNNPPHVPQGGNFQTPPTNSGSVLRGSTKVFINGKPAARVNDPVQTCNDPAPAPTCKIL